MPHHPPAVHLTDHAPPAADLLREVVASLRLDPPQLPCKFLYDSRGSALFEAICELPEYYPTRTELGILRQHISAIADRLGPHCMVIEPGSGSSLKTDLLLEHLASPVAYVPIEISRDQLIDTANALAERHPAIEVLPICADYLQPVTLPQPRILPRRWVVFFPGSTIGNFHAPQARAFLQRIARMTGPGGALLIGVDLRKSPDLLLPAYDDAQGVTAAFNLNLLHRINREAGGNFNVDQFEHRAVWNDAHSRVEMHLVARTAQSVQLGGETFRFARGEAIRTECSYKHTLESFAALADDFDVQAVWTDSAQRFSVQYLTVRLTARGGSAA